MSIIHLTYFLGRNALHLKIKKRALLIWTKNDFKIALSVLDAVKVRFPETQEFIDSTLKECEKG